jgi:FtsZ-binding cell division protein ZapB
LRIVKILYYRYKDSEFVPTIITTYIYFSVEELLKKNPSLREKVAELQKAHDKAEREANRIESKQEILGMDDDKV